MKWNRIREYGVLLLVGLACAVAQAASLSSTDLPAGSNWYVHVNLDLIRNSEAGRQLMLETLDDAVEEIEEELGVNLIDEVQGVTLFGGKLPSHGSRMSEGAVILHGSIGSDSQATVLSALEREGAEVTSSFQGSLAYYTVTEGHGSMTYTDEEGHQEDVSWGDREPLYFSFGATQTLMTHSQQMMQSFLEAGGTLDELESVDPAALVVLQADRALLQGGANTTHEIGGDWDSSVLKNVDSVALLVAEDGGGLQISAELTATSAEVAMSVRNIVEGLVALKALDDSDEMIGDILRGVRFQNDGAILRINVYVAADQIEALQDL